MKINVNTITIGLIIAGMILSSSLQAKAFTPVNNTAARATAVALAANAAVLHANANKERERDKEKEPDMVTTAFIYIALPFSFALLFMCLSRLDGLSLKKDNGI